MRFTASALVSSFLLVILPCASADAASIALKLDVANIGCAPGTTLVSTNGGHENVLEAATTDVEAGISISATCNTFGPTYTLAATGTFDAGPTLGTFVSLDVPVPGDYTSDAFAQVTFSDVVAVSGGETGTPGFLEMSYLLSGSTQTIQDHWGSSSASLSASAGHGGVAGGLVTGTTSVDLRIPIIFGEASPLEVTLSSQVVQNDFIPRSDTIFSDFLHTADLQSLSVLDATGTPLSDGRVVSSSGLSYQEQAPETTPVPEPATLLLTGIGALGLARARRQRTGRVSARSIIGRACRTIGGRQP